jgi:hypothetical protein
MEILLADLIDVVHLGIVLFVIVGQALILVGWPLRWGWIRHFWFRIAHLGTIAWVAVQGMCGEICPLTIWSRKLRDEAAIAGQERTFVGQLAYDILFVDVPQATLDKIYVVFALLVLVTFVFCRPRRRRERGDVAGTS